MNCSQTEALFLDILEDIVAAEQRAQFEQHIATCFECQKDFEQYRGLMKLEQIVATELPQAPAGLHKKIACGLDQVELEVCPSLRARTRKIVSVLASANLCLLCVLGSMLIQPKDNRLAITPLMSVAALNTPAGYEAVTVGLAEPNSESSKIEGFVDIRCAYSENGESKTADISRLVRVHSTERKPVLDSFGRDSGKEQLQVTLLVPEQQVRQVMLARVLGDLMLEHIPVGASDAQMLPPTANTLFDPDGRRVPTDARPYLQAVLYQADQKTGQTMRQIYDNGKWVSSTGEQLLVF